MDYSTAGRHNENKLLTYLYELCPDWKEIAESLLAWMSDDEVKEWAENDGYDIFEDEDEEE